MKYPGSFNLWREFLATLSRTGKVEAEPGDLVERIYKRLSPKVEIDVVKAHSDERGTYSIIDICFRLGNDRVHIASIYGYLKEESTGYYFLQGADAIISPYDREVPFVIAQKTLEKKKSEYGGGKKRIEEDEGEEE